MVLRGGLLTRLALALALVGLLPVGFAAYRLIDLNRRAMETQVQSTHHMAARTAAERVDNFLLERLALAGGLASHPALAEPRSGPAQTLLSESLQAWSESGVLALAVVTPAGEEVIRAQLKVGATPEHVEAALGGRSEDPVFVAPGIEPPVLRLQVSLRGETGRLQLVAAGGRLTEALDAYELGEEAELVLIDEQGRVLAGPPGALASFPEEVVRNALSRRISGVKPHSPGEGEEEQISAYAQVDQAPWAVLSRQPARIAYAVAGTMRRQAALVVAATVGLIALLSSGAYWSVVRPIRQLAQAQRRLAGIPGGAAAGGDEIDQLRASFEALEQKMAEREALDEIFLGRYQVRDILGSGAMGTVFRGWDPKLQRPVALKTVRLDRKLSEGRRRELISRLLNEAVTVARFNHPNIVAVFDVEDSAGAAFVAMELVDGMSLETTLWRDGPLAPDQVVLLGAGIARALAAAHDNGVVHRDVKPANVLLGADGSIKVTDFGISELISSMSGEAGVVFGTPGYVPPETLQGQGFDEAGDLFSMGAVLYFALTGRQPFEGKTVREVIRRTLFGVLTPPSRVVDGVPETLEQLIVGLLDREPTERPGGARQIADRLAALGDELEARWRPPEPGEAGEAEAPGAAPSQWLATTRLAAAAPPPAATRRLPSRPNR